VVASAVELPYVTVKYEAPIVYFYYKEGIELGISEVREMVALAERLSEGKNYVTFSDVRVDINLTEDARRFVGGMQNMPLFRGAAILVKSTLYSFAVNFIGGYSRNKYPFKAFLTEEKAVGWLLSLPLD
jgi:hypothetical protein